MTDDHVQATDPRAATEDKVWVQAEVTRHLQSKISDLGLATLKKRRIYLDVNYWTHLADAMEGKPRHPDHQRLLACLKTAVLGGDAICVVGDDTLLELIKRKDPSKRLLLARTLDYLSAGTTIQHSFERAELEISRFVRRVETEEASFRPDHLVWRLPCSILGDIFPVPGPPISRRDAATLSKAYLDYVWAMTFETLVGRLNSAPSQPFSWDQTASALNAGNVAHQSEVGAFGEVFLKEAAGVLDVVGLDVAHRQVRDDLTGSTTVIGALNAFDQLKARVLLAFEQGTAGVSLPYVDIHAGIHAAVRRDKQRRLKPNDFHDFGHAAAALPYCSDFLTDGSLRTLLCSGPLNFDQKYSCRVMSSVSEALGVIGA